MLQASDFEQLAQRLGREAVERPRWYRLRVRLWGVFGYVWIAVALAAMLAVVGLIIAIVIAEGVSTGGLWAIAALLVVIATVLGALRIQDEEPKGIELDRSNAPRLLDEMATIRERLRVPKIHRVLATIEMNAAVVESPRLGIFGWYRRYLVIGVPLLLGLSPAAFRAVLTHELAHLSRAHGRIGAWVYRVRKRWVQIARALEERETAFAAPFTAFFGWYAPRFEAYSAALSRLHEFEADADAAAVGGPEAHATALKTLEILGRQIHQRHWPEVWADSATEPEPPTGVLDPFIAGLDSPPPGASSWLAEALEWETRGFETHPSLSERLTAIGDPEPDRVPPWPDPGTPNAADHFLADPETVIRRVEDSWRRQARQAWVQSYEARAPDRARIEELEPKVAGGDASPEEEWELATALMEVRGPEAALPVLWRLVGRAEPRPEWRYALGITLLQTGDPAGIEHIEAAADAHWSFIAGGCSAVIEFLEREGRGEEARPFRERLEEQRVEEERAWEERQTVEAGDTLIPHDLDEEAVDAIRAMLRDAGKIAVAYIARKEVEYLPDSPPFVLAFAARRWLWTSRKATRTKAVVLAEALRHVNANFILIPLVGNATDRWIRKEMEKLPGAKIHPGPAFGDVPDPVVEPVASEFGAETAPGRVLEPLPWTEGTLDDQDPDVALEEAADTPALRLDGWEGGPVRQCPACGLGNPEAVWTSEECGASLSGTMPFEPTPDPAR